MKDEKGNALSEKEILKIALDNLSNACCFLFEMESYSGKCLAFTVDSALKLGQILYDDECPLMACTDYAGHEYEKYLMSRNNLEVIK